MLCLPQQSRWGSRLWSLFFRTPAALQMPGLHRRNAQAPPCCGTNAISHKRSAMRHAAAQQSCPAVPAHFARLVLSLHAAEA
jgi:hypothetical protein